MLYEAPMHPYRMQVLIKERGKDEVINVGQRASLYQTIRRLERERLIVAQSSSRHENRPERTVYELTASGRQILLDWMRSILSTPTPEFSEFPAAVSFLPLLSPKDAQRQFTLRAQAIEFELARMDEQVRMASFVPRLFLLETEYIRSAHLAELTWLRAVVADLAAGKLTWSKAWLRKMAAELVAAHAEKSEKTK
jgi:DNA-binding PadR family transcriptional regulator